MTGRFIIYALVDPRDGAWRYIGKSTSGLKRPRSHMMPSSVCKRSTHKENWVRALISVGLLPEIEIVESQNNADALNEAECEWIAAARRCGVSLTNGTDGGEGVSNPSKETLAKRKASLLTTFAQKPEILKRLSDRMSKLMCSRSEEVAKQTSASWKDPAVRQRRIAGIRAYCRTEEGVETKRRIHKEWLAIPANIEKVRAVTLARMAIPSERAKISEHMKLRMASPVERAIKADAMRARMASPEARAAHGAAIRVRLSSAEARAQMSARTKRLWESPEYRAKVLATRSRKAAIQCR